MQSDTGMTKEEVRRLVASYATTLGIKPATVIFLPRFYRNAGLHLLTGMLLIDARLLDELPEKYLRAILAHEMGHKKDRARCLYTYLCVGIAQAIAMYGGTKMLLYAVSELFMERSTDSTVQFLVNVMLICFYGTLWCSFGNWARLIGRPRELFADMIAASLAGPDYIAGYLHWVIEQKRVPVDGEVEERLHQLGACDQSPRRRTAQEITMALFCAAIISVTAIAMGSAIGTFVPTHYSQHAIAGWAGLFGVMGLAGGAQAPLFIRRRRGQPTSAQRS